MVQLCATMEQTHETQLAQLYDVLGFRRVIARNYVLSTLHESGPCTIRAPNIFMWVQQALAIFWVYICLHYQAWSQCGMHVVNYVSSFLIQMFIMEASEEKDLQNKMRGHVEFRVFYRRVNGVGGGEAHARTHVRKYALAYTSTRAHQNYIL